jgi:hypothetical protein
MEQELPARTRIESKTKRRGFVMTGGGAKGLYEAGVINAFHLTGMEFEIITGSSIGAMNSIFFAEYLWNKKSLAEKIPDDDPDKALKLIEQMEEMMLRYHHTWLLMPTEQIIDDSKDGALSRLVNQVGDLNINLSDLVTLGWWMTDPRLSELPKSDAGSSFLHTTNRLIIALGNGNAFKGLGELTWILTKYHNRKDIIREVLRVYLRNLGLEYSLIPGTQNGKEAGPDKIERMFTRKVLPLQREQLSGSIAPQTVIPENGKPVVDPDRTLKDYWDKGIDVRLTRANYRTGRLEIAAYLSSEAFLTFMQNQAWRLQKAGLDKMPLGSFRLQLPGNPKAIKAALASGRFPGVFAPFPFTEIYPAQYKENGLLYKLLSSNQSSASDIEAMKTAYCANLDEKSPSGNPDDDCKKLLDSWQASAPVRDFFPFPEDKYVDGGSIDNTPSNSAVDATREWIENQEGRLRKRDVVLELYVIFLEKEPRLDREKAADPLLYEVVQRTLAIQSAAVKTSDAVVVDTINNFGDRGDELARSLLAVIDGIEKSSIMLDQNQLQALEDCILDEAPSSFLYSYSRTKGPRGTLEFMKGWAEDMLASKLPLQVDEVKIYPDDMTVSTLQFTERLGYRQTNAIEMITMGCYNTLTAIKARLDKLQQLDTEEETTPTVKGIKQQKMDDQDKKSLALVNKWMSFQEGFELGWVCTRAECIFHQDHCAHGLMAKWKTDSN